MIHTKNIRVSTISLILFIILIISITVVYISFATEDAMKESIREKLTTIANISASGINGSTFSKIQIGAENTSDYKTILNTIRLIRRSDPKIRFIYTMRLVNNHVLFVVDADYGIKPDAANIGDVYPDAEPELIQGFSHPTANREFTTDEWGTVMSGFSPIQDYNGTNVGIVGVDIDNSIINSQIHHIKTLYCGIGLISMIISTVFILIIDYRREIYEKNLRESRDRLQFSLDSAGAGEWELDPTDNTIIQTHKIDEIFGYHTGIKNWTFDRFLDHIIPEEQDTIRSQYDGIIKKRGKFSFETRITTQSGNIRWVWIAGRPTLDSDGTIERIIGLIFDITERKEAEAAIQKALDEKEILLHEIHHRVKNNMQIISSLISMQARTISDETTRLHISSTQSRIRSIALVYEELAMNDNFEQIECQSFLQKLVHSIYSLYSVNQNKIRIYIDAHLTLSMTEAVPCALIFRELLSNSVTHAFPDGRDGEIQIHAVYKTDMMRYIFEYRDNGIGIPSDIKISQAKTIGMQLIHGLAKQISGEVRIGSQNGTYIILSFPKNGN